jgi:hypothetical protein
MGNGKHGHLKMACQLRLKGKSSEQAGNKLDLTAFIRNIHFFKRSLFNATGIYGAVREGEENKWRKTAVISEAGHSCGNKKGKNEMGRACTKNVGRNSGKEKFHWTTRGQQEEGKAQTEMAGRSGGRSEENRNKRIERDAGRLLQRSRPFQGL